MRSIATKQVYTDTIRCCQIGDPNIFFFSHSMARFFNSIITDWERTAHPALYIGRIIVPLCRELIIFVF